VTLPPLRAGQLISYVYLWARQHRQGAEEGSKDRPCVIVAVRPWLEGRDIVTVVPVTHTPPDDRADAVEIPGALKAHLGLDEAPSWVVVIETNDFLWPGPDIRPDGEFGFLPPKFFAHIRDRILSAHLRRKLDRVARTE
jgi:hypothetical protein